MQTLPLHGIMGQKMILSVHAGLTCLHLLLSLIAEVALCYLAGGNEVWAVSLQ